jgi:maltose O-acetyltransferase
VALLRRLRKKVLKRWARDAFFPGWRLVLLRWTGVRIGRDVYIADGLLIVEELSGDELITLGDRVSLAPRVTLVTSPSEPEPDRSGSSRREGPDHHRGRRVDRSRCGDLA